MNKRREPSEPSLDDLWLAFVASYRLRSSDSLGLGIDDITRRLFGYHDLVAANGSTARILSPMLRVALNPLDDFESVLWPLPFLAIFLSYGLTALARRSTSLSDGVFTPR